MTLTDTINDIVAQASALLSPVDLSDWTPPEDAPFDKLAELEEAEYERRAKARLDAYLADRSDRLACLRAIREAAGDRAEAYKAQAAPWLRLAKRQEGLREYVEQLARNVLEAERQAAGFDPDEGYEVTLPNGVKMGLRPSPPSVVVESIEDLPGRYVKVTKTADKTEIAKAIKAGRVVTGAKLARGVHVFWGR